MTAAIDPNTLANDPSLRYYPYRRWECLWSDDHNRPVRFLEYVDKGKSIIKVAEMSSIRELPETVQASRVRRPPSEAGSMQASPLPAEFLRVCDEARDEMRKSKNGE